MYKSNSPFEYIFEIRKRLVAFPNGISAEKYVRGKFLDMYKNNPSYFLNSSTNAFWKSVNNNVPFKDVEELHSFLLGSSRDSTLLKFILVK